jgi:hypothetical protein
MKNFVSEGPASAHFFYGLEAMDRKTKRVASVDLPAHSFAYVGDEQKPETWHLPLFVRGDAAKSLNLTKNALHRFDQTKGIPASERAAVWFTLYGAAKAQGLNIERKEFADVNEAPMAAAEPEPIRVTANRQRSYVDDPQIAEAIALADRRCDYLLRQLGLE